MVTDLTPLKIPDGYWLINRVSGLVVFAFRRTAGPVPGTIWIATMPNVPNTFL